MEWQEKSTVKKGNIGERIVFRILEAKGLIIYRCTQNKPHAVDFYAQFKGKTPFAAEVKTYPRQYAYTRTGIDTYDYNTYLNLLNDGIEVLVFFVDQFEECVYQQRISILKNFAQQANDKTYFPLGCLKYVRGLTRAELDQIRKYSRIDQELYRNTKPFFTHSAHI